MTACPFTQGGQNHVTKVLRTSLFLFLPLSQTTDIFLGQMRAIIGCSEQSYRMHLAPEVVGCRYHGGGDGRQQGGLCVRQSPSQFQVALLPRVHRSPGKHSACPWSELPDVNRPIAENPALSFCRKCILSSLAVVARL